MCSAGLKRIFLKGTFQTTLCWQTMVATPEGSLSKYRSKSVLFQLIFETKVLKTIPREAIMPWMKSSHRANLLSEKYEGKFLMVKMTPHQDLFQKIPPNKIKPFWFFVRVIMQKRKDKLIAVIERWMPGAGVRLIALGYTIYTKCGSLKPEEVLDLFKEFSSWPEYEFSSFTSSMEGLLVRMLDPGEAELIMTETEKRAKTKTEESSEDLENSAKINGEESSYYLEEVSAKSKDKDSRDKIVESNDEESRDNIEENSVKSKEL